MVVVHIPLHWRPDWNSSIECLWDSWLYVNCIPSMHSLCGLRSRFQIQIQVPAWGIKKDLPPKCVGWGLYTFFFQIIFKLFDYFYQVLLTLLINGISVDWLVERDWRGSGLALYCTFIEDQPSQRKSSFLDIHKTYLNGSSTTIHLLSL